MTEILVNIFSPVPEKTLRRLLTIVRRAAGLDLKGPALIEKMLKDGRLEKHFVEGVSYLWLSGFVEKSDSDPAVGDRVKFLAPFDPVVWDRERFEHLWGWPYRFEAYTPPKKRIRGYYALPLLWRDEVIGWANVDRSSDEMSVDVGYVGKGPCDKKFLSELEREIERMREFLGPYCPKSRAIGNNSQFLA